MEERSPFTGKISPSSLTVSISADYVIQVVNGITGVAAVAAATDLFLDLRHCVVWDADLGALLRTSQ
jgi:hypothetical protein